MITQNQLKVLLNPACTGPLSKVKALERKGFVIITREFRDPITFSKVAEYQTTEKGEIVFETYFGILEKIAEAQESDDSDDPTGNKLIEKELE
jgi:DNA-binding PadR family transcriptional regulator